MIKSYILKTDPAGFPVVSRQEKARTDAGGEETGALGPRDGDSRARESNGTVKGGKAKQRCQSRELCL